MNQGIVTLNDITNGLININIMEVQIINSKNGRVLVPSEYWCIDSTFITVRREKEKWEWVGNNHKTIVLTAGKDIDSFYCSQCCHIAEGLCLSQ